MIKVFLQIFTAVIFLTFPTVALSQDKIIKTTQNIFWGNNRKILSRTKNGKD